MDSFVETKIAKILSLKTLKVATAESCTGGLIGHRITNVAGSSQYYLGSIIAYADQVKNNLLAVKLETLEKLGAVSVECVTEMAEGVCSALKSDIGLSVSGIAGPGGGTKEKPVGLVYFGLKTPDGLWTSKQNFDGDRISIKENAAEFALNYLLRYLTGDIDN